MTISRLSIIKGVLLTGIMPHTPIIRSVSQSTSLKLIGVLLVSCELSVSVTRGMEFGGGKWCLTGGSQVDEASCNHIPDPSVTLMVDDSLLSPGSLPCLTKRKLGWFNNIPSFTGILVSSPSPVSGLYCYRRYRLHYTHLSNVIKNPHLLSAH